MSTTSDIGMSGAKAVLAQRLIGWIVALIARNAVTVGAVLFIGFVGLACLASAKLPRANWDLLPYVAASAEARIPDPVALHLYAYDSVRTAVDADGFDKIVNGDAYRRYQYDNPSAFVSMLPMYRVKALYVSLVSKLAPFTGGEIAAIRLISLLSTLATGLCVGLWLYRERAFAFSPLAIGALMISGYPEIGRLGSPDAMFMALLTFGLYALTQKREAVPALALFLAFLVRSDTIAFLGILAALFVMFRQMSLAAFVAFVAAVIAYSTLSHGAGHPGWWTHFWFSNVSQVLTMEGFHPDFSLSVYLRAVISGLVRSATEQAWPGLLVVLISAWAFLRTVLGRVDLRMEIIFLALVGGVIARFILFPLPDARVHGAYLTPLLLVLLPSIKTLLSVWRPARNA